MRKLTLCGLGLIMGLALANMSWASITCPHIFPDPDLTYAICGDSVDAKAETGDPFCPGLSDIPCECGDEVLSSTSLSPVDDPVVDGTPCGGNGLSVTVKDNILLDCQSNTLRGTPGNFGTGLFVYGVSGVFLKKCGDVDFDAAAVIAYSNDVTIDCGSATWRGNFFDDGITLDHVTTATIKNCEVKNFFDGIHATESDLITLNSVKSKFNFIDGVHFDNVTSSTVKASFLQDNGDDGIELHENDGNTVQGTRIERNAYEAVSKLISLRKIGPSDNA